MMDWIILSIFKSDDRWIPSFVRSSIHRFRSDDADYVHDRSRANASLSDWRDYFAHGWRAWRGIRASRTPTGVVTVFPQLTLVIGLLKRLTFSRVPLIAWMFNVNRAYTGLQGYAARFGLSAVDRFVVHSTHEVAVYSGWLRLPRERFVFVPLSVEDHPITETEDFDAPFLLSMGSANRDYALLFEALSQSPYRTIVVAGAHALAGLEIPPHVEVRSNLSEAECRALCQRARLCVVPLKSIETASGQVTVVEGMMAGRAVVATQSVGTVDYVEQDVDGILVPQGDVARLREAIDRLWSNDEARLAIAQAARHSALTKFTFAAVALHFERLVDQFVSDDGTADVARARG